MRPALRPGPFHPQQMKPHPSIHFVQNSAFASSAAAQRWGQGRQPWLIRRGCCEGTLLSRAAGTARVHTAPARTTFCASSSSSMPWARWEMLFTQLKNSSICNEIGSGRSQVSARRPLNAKSSVASLAGALLPSACTHHRAVAREQARTGLHSGEWAGVNMRSKGPQPAAFRVSKSSLRTARRWIEALSMTIVAPSGWRSYATAGRGEGKATVLLSEESTTTPHCRRVRVAAGSPLVARGPNPSRRTIISSRSPPSSRSQSSN